MEATLNKSLTGKLCEETVLDVTAMTMTATWAPTGGFLLCLFTDYEYQVRQPPVTAHTEVTANAVIISEECPGRILLGTKNASFLYEFTSTVEVLIRTTTMGGKKHVVVTVYQPNPEVK